MNLKSEIVKLQQLLKPKKEIKVIFDAKDATGPEHIIYVLFTI